MNKTARVILSVRQLPDVSEDGLKGECFTHVRNANFVLRTSNI